MSTNQEASLGDKVRECVTGFTGIVTGKADYIAGCTQVCVAPPLKQDGTMADAQWFDVERVEVIEAGAVTVKRRPTGGPGSPSERAPAR